MKTAELVIGLIRLVVCVGFLVAMWLPGASVLWIAIYFVAAMSAMIPGVCNVMDACFGKGGLVCELFPVREERP
jgi:hypothetical protein